MDQSLPAQLQVVCMAGLAPHMIVTRGKGSDEHSPMPSNPAGWFFKYGLSLYISEGYIRYSKYSTLWLYWGILRAE